MPCAPMFTIGDTAQIRLDGYLCFIHPETPVCAAQTGIPMAYIRPRDGFDPNIRFIPWQP